MTKPGDKMRLDIARIMGTGQGTAFTEDGVLVLIDGVDENDESVDVEITRIYEESIFAEKVGSVRVDRGKVTRGDLTNSPYDLDDEEEDYDDYDDEDDD